LEIIASPVTTAPLGTAPSPAVSAKVRPPVLPPLATSFQTDAKPERIEETLEAAPRPGKSFTRPVVEARAPDSPLTSRTPGTAPRARDQVIPPPLPGSSLPERAAPTPTARPAQAATAQSEAAASADEPWMSEAIGGQSASPQRRKKRSALSFFLQYILGGAVGLALAVAILFWVFKVDLLKMARHLPEFMVPEQLMPKEEPTSGSATLI
jgi:hypothetical protein